MACGQLALESGQKSKVSPLHLLGKQIGADLPIRAYTVADTVVEKEAGVGNHEGNEDGDGDGNVI